MKNNSGGAPIKWEKVLAAILIVIISFVYFTTLSSSEYYIADWFSTDDAFYYFKIANNITQGMGSSFDGIAKTNGYHPLWMMILIPIFFFSRIDIYLPLRVVILFQLGFAIGTALLFFNYLRTKVALASAFLVSLVWILLLPIFRVTSNGTEAAVNAFFLTLFWVTLSRFNARLDDDKYNFREILPIGLIALFVLFSRLDNIFILLVCGLWLGFQYLVAETDKQLIPKTKNLLKIELTYFLPMTFPLGLYFLWNVNRIGSIMPLSGQLKKFWGTLPQTAYGVSIAGIGDFLGEFFSSDKNMGPWNLFTRPLYSIVDSLSVDYYYGTKQVSLGLLLVIAVAFCIGYLVARHREFVFSKVRIWSVFPLFIGTVLQISYYKLNGYLAPRPWYWVAEMFLIVIILTLLVEIFFQEILSQQHRYSRLLVVGFTIIGVFLVVSPHMNQIIRQIANQQKQTHNYFEKSSWLEENTKSDSIIGMTGAGSTSYFINNRTIVNLDGLVNGKAYFDQLQTEKAGNYLKENQITHIFGNEYILSETDPYQGNFGGLLERSQIIGKFNDRLILWAIEY